MVFIFIFSGYESFKMETSYLKSFYSTDEEVKRDCLDEPESEDKYSDQNDQEKVISKLSNRSEYNYYYCTFLVAKFLRCCCCCCKKHSCMNTRITRLEYHTDCVDRLQEEIDIVGLI